ncbi:MAG: Bpu10I family restriction endonuclease [Acidobacteriota bacterium]
MTMPTPHLEKLNAVLENDKLPATDRPRIEGALKRYEKWIEDMRRIEVDEEQASALEKMIGLFDEYKRYFDLDVIFDSEEDFLYRQKGQLKLDNSIIEEFLPWLLRPPVFADAPADLACGPSTCYSAVYFESSLGNSHPGAGIHLRTKDQDFALSRKLYIRASHSPDFDCSEDVSTYIAYVATEVKTNLDKTMFQEACATARDLRMAVPAARYFLMCEWLDMTPVSTAPTDISEVLLLRGAKRLGSNMRKCFATSRGRKSARSEFSRYLVDNPFRADVFGRWLGHIRGLLDDGDPAEDDVLGKGYF